MPRPSQLSPDNILRFLQVRSAPASSEEIAAALHMPKTERRALDKMLSKLTKRRAVEELPGGRYRLADRREKRSADGQPSSPNAFGHATSGLGTGRLHRIIPERECDSADSPWHERDHIDDSGRMVGSNEPGRGIGVATSTSASHLRL